MADDIESLLRDANRLADALKEASEKSDDWFVRNNVLSFVATIEDGRDDIALRRGAHALSHFVSDQYDITPSVHQVSKLAERARDIAKRSNGKKG